MKIMNYKVPKKSSIKLPENIDLNTNGNPLDHQDEWKNNYN